MTRSIPFSIQVVLWVFEVLCVCRDRVCYNFVKYHHASPSKWWWWRWWRWDTSKRSIDWLTQESHSSCQACLYVSLVSVFCESSFVSQTQTKLSNRDNQRHSCYKNVLTEIPVLPLDMKRECNSNVYSQYSLFFTASKREDSLERQSRKTWRHHWQWKKM
jgi:hypothetical protein